MLSHLVKIVGEDLEVRFASTYAQPPYWRNGHCLGKCLVGAGLCTGCPKCNAYIVPRLYFGRGTHNVLGVKMFLECSPKGGGRRLKKYEDRILIYLEAFILF